MKIFKITFLVLVTGGLLFFANCGGGDDKPTPEEELTELLTSKQWVYSDILLPTPNATEESDWTNFKVTFSSSNMTPIGHATGAGVVWPDGGWDFTSDLGGIVRAKDGITMTINTLNATTLNVTFVIPPGTEIGGRVAELGGEYTFILE